MISTNRTETETRYFSGAHGTDPRVDSETRYVFSGSGRLSICRGAIEFGDRYGADNRQTVTLWFDGDEVASAVVDWLAALHNGAANEANQHSRETCRETLARFAGAIGLDYLAALPESAPVAD